MRGKMDRKTILELPKIELHSHLDGSLSIGAVRTLLGRTVEPEELMVAEDCKSLAEYLEKFNVPLACLQTTEGLKRGGYDFMEQISSEGLKYAEVRFAPQFSTSGGLSLRQVIESVLEGLERGKKEFGTDYQVIVCAMRHQSEEENAAMLKTAREYLGFGVCAADLAGDEAAYPMTEFLSLFEKVKRLEMPFTLHAGECGSVENIIASVACGAKRIGHGIAMRGHNEAKRLCKENRIGVEMCPISNLQTKAVLDGSMYPIREFLDEGLLVTLNTDNRTVSNTSVTKEIEHVQANYGVTDEEIIQMQKNAVEVSFAPEEQKERMRGWFPG